MSAYVRGDTTAQSVMSLPKRREPPGNCPKEMCLPAHPDLFGKIGHPNSTPTASSPVFAANTIPRTHRRGNLSAQRIRTWKRSHNPHFDRKKLIRRFCRRQPPGAAVVCFDEWGHWRSNRWAGSLGPDALGPRACAPPTIADCCASESACPNCSKPSSGCAAAMPARSCS